MQGIVSPPIVVAVMLAGLLASCTGADRNDATSPTRVDAASSSSTEATPPNAPNGEVDTPGNTKAPLPPRPPRRLSLQAVMATKYSSKPIHVMREIADYGAYTRSEIRYRSDGLSVSGILNVPRGRGPFPGLVLAHGYIEPSLYVTGQGLSREQDFLARAGYVVLHTDYRGHAASDAGTILDRETRLGYTEDVITAVHALEKMPYVDRDRMGLLGRSMGGGVAFNAIVAKPDLVDAAVMYAPVSSRFLDNVNRWTRPERPEVAATLFDRLGMPREGGGAYRDLSPRAFFDRVAAAVLIHHGTADESCPLRWSRSTFRALERADASARLAVYPGEPHAFVDAWSRSMRLTTRFLEGHL